MSDTRFCERCGMTCDRGYSERWRDDELISTHCLDCAHRIELDEYVATKRLSLNLVTMAQIGAPSEYRQASWKDSVEAEICDAARRLHVDVQAFERGVWFAGAQAQATKASTMSADLGDGLKLLSWTMCGRAMLTIDGPEDSVTVMTDETRKTPGGMGLRGIDATEEAARKLIHDAIAAWRRGARLKEDGEIRYL